MTRGKTAIFLSIREKATRLPKKVLLPIKGKAVTEHLIERLKTAKRADQLIMTTSVHPDDQVLAGIAEKCQISCFRGSEDDKLDRYFQAAQAYRVDFIVIVDGDDLLCDPVYIDRVIRKHQKTGADFVYCQGLPLGAASSGFTLKALERVCQIKRESDTEVWGGYFTKTGLFHVECVEAEEPLLRRPDVRMTLDYKEDYQFFQKIFDALYVPGRVFSLEEVMSLLARKPEIVQINQGVQKLYEENLARHTKISYEIPPRPPLEKGGRGDLESSR
jgi:spore coat polysaccharide biosynthesis protein SpsF (cytidylyltransferase family)